MEKCAAFRVLESWVELRCFSSVGDWERRSFKMADAGGMMKFKDCDVFACHFHFQRRNLINRADTVLSYHE